MEQLEHKDFDALWKVLANPADVKYAYQSEVSHLVDEFPQSGIFRALLAASGDQQNIRNAAAYYNSSALYKIVNAPANLRDVDATQIAVVEKPVLYVKPEVAVAPVDEGETQGTTLVFDNFDSVEHAPVTAEVTEHTAETIPTEVAEEEAPRATLVFDNFDSVGEIAETPKTEPVAETEPSYLLAETAIDEQTVTPVAAEELYDPFAEIISQEVPATANEDHLLTETTSYEEEAEQPVAEPEPVAEIEPVHYPVAEPADVRQDLAAVEIAQPVQPVTEEKQPEPVQNIKEETQYFHQDIDDEIYDEIVSIEDINLEQLAAYEKESNKADHFVLEQEPVSESEPEQIQHSNSSPEPHFIVEAPTAVANVAGEPLNEKQDLSKYNDEKLPYTFMWWLDKTRREYAAAYQPYVYNTGFQSPAAATPAHTTPPPAAPPIKKSSADELQQQYVESIFNVSVIDDVERKPPVANDQHIERKGDKIIKRFIQAEPHIKHPGNVKLDNENKAKKSSEDADEFVTETLARIYTEQMLYQKAILTYKKLMLKFPEKSLYFAGQIEQLEKKPN